MKRFNLLLLIVLAVLNTSIAQVLSFGDSFEDNDYDSEVPKLYKTSLDGGLNVVAKNITVFLDADGKASVHPSQIDASGHDHSLIESMSVYPRDFSSEHVGEKMVTLTMSDVHGNSASNFSQVTIVDNLHPIVRTKNIRVKLNKHGMAFLEPSHIDDGCSDNCGISKMFLSQEAFNKDHIGSNIVTLSVEDINGNVSEAMAIVIVSE